METSGSRIPRTCAKPYYVERSATDKYQSVMFPNYHFVKLTVEKGKLHGVMYRVENPESKTLGLEVKDEFDVGVKAR